MRWQTILGLMAGVYVMNRVFGWAYKLWPWIDNPMHILGGVLAACLGLALWQELSRREKIKGVPAYAIALYLIAFTALIATLWEFYEFISDWFILRAGGTLARMEPSVADTIKDLANGLTGACLVVLAARKKLV